MSKRFALFCGSCGLLLGSATPPAQTAAAPSVLATAQTPAAPPALRQAPAPVAIPARAAPAPAPPPASAPPILPKPAASPIRGEERERARAEADAVRIVVSLPLQRLYVFRGEELLATSPVSTGRRGHATPTGRFPIIQKRIRHFSNLYDNAPMPYMQRLTHTGIALHGGRLPGYPASHGCIRLPHAFARRLYRLTDFSTVVTITNQRPRSAREAIRLI